MDSYQEFIKASEEEIFLAIMDRLGIKLTPLGPIPPTEW